MIYVSTSFSAELYIALYLQKYCTVLHRKLLQLPNTLLILTGVNEPDVMVASVECRATFNCAPQRQTGILQSGASKMAASMAGRHLQFKEQLLLTETDGHFGGAFGHFCLLLKNRDSLEVNFNLNANLQNIHCGANSESTLRCTLNMAEAFYVEGGESESWPSQTNDKQTLHLSSLPSLLFSITRIGKG